MANFERPAPDITKITEAWRSWTSGDEILPGRTMADLKMGGVDRVLETLVAEAEADSLAPALDAWTLWERGKVGPEDTLAALAAADFDQIVAALSEPA